MSEFKIGSMEIHVPPAVNMMAMVVIIVLGVVSMSLYETNKNHKITINDLRDSLKLASDKSDNIWIGYSSYKMKYDNLMDKAWHSGEDLVAYIGDKYPKVPVEVSRLIADSINSAIDEHPMDFSLVVGIMEVESKFNPMAVSKKGAAGLMQVMPNIWSDTLGITNEEDFYDIEINVLSGVRIFLHNLEVANGDIDEALWRYNGINGKKGEFADRVYKTVGRFETFRAMINGDYESDEENKVSSD